MGCGVVSVVLRSGADVTALPSRSTTSEVGFRVQGSGFRVQGAGFRVQGPGFRVQGSGLRVQGSGFKVQGLRFMMSKFGGNCGGLLHLCLRIMSLGKL